MTRDELEREVWHELRHLGADTHPQAVTCVDVILNAADTYALAEDTAPALRRTVLHEARDDIGFDTQRGSEAALARWNPLPLFTPAERDAILMRTYGRH